VIVVWFHPFPPVFGVRVVLQTLDTNLYSRLPFTRFSIDTVLLLLLFIPRKYQLDGKWQGFLSTKMDKTG
jgi:hypothetical protein